jgi:thermopsin
MARWGGFRGLWVLGLVAIMLFSSLSTIGSITASAAVGHTPSAPLAEHAVAPSAPAAAPPGSPAASAVERAASLEKTLRDRGVPAGSIHLPNLAAESTSKTGTVGPTYAQAPAPVGVADIGIHNVSGTLRGYTLYTASAEGTITLNNASSTYIDGDGADMFGIQMNTVLTNVTIAGKSTYQFWTQNFVSYTPSSGWLAFGDNVWNFSTLSGYFPTSSLYAYGPNGSLFAPIFYYAVGPSFTIHYPFTITFYNNATLINGRSAVYFNYTLSNATMSRSGSFDFVIFNSVTPTYPGPAPAPEFQVNGKFYDPIGLINDIELDVVGNDDGDTTVFTAVNATLSIAAWNTSKDQFVPAQSAYNCGDDTGETSTGLAVFWNGTGAVAQMRPGPSFIAGLWNVSSAVGVRLVQLTLAPANAFVFVSPGASFNASIAQWVPAASSPIDFYLSNLGTYSLVAELSNFDPSSQALTFAANTTDPISVTLTADPSRGMYTPLYAWSNAQLAAISSAGIGTTSNPYVLYNDQNASFNPEFAQWNDFEFPVFAGIQLVGTSAAVSITPSSLEINYPAWMQAQLTGAGQPSTNELQLLFFLVTNVTIRGAPGISGWQSVDLSPYPMGSVIFWNSSGNLVAGNTFNDEGAALALFGGTDNTIWDNWFLPATANASNPGNLNAAGANEISLNLSEDGDLVYDNAFLTPVDAYTPTQNPLLCQVECEPVLYTDAWNVSQQPAANGHMVNGVNLTGSIIGTSYQGGNYWWNYGTPSDPYDALPYNDTGFITSGGDYVPLSFTSLYTVTFRESGLAPGTRWEITSEGVDLYSNSTSLGLQSPAGSFAYVVGAVTGYTEPTSSYFTVVASNITVDLPFHLDYAVTFRATGLPVSSTWSLTLLTSRHHLQFSGSANGTGTIVASIDNGTYNYTVGDVTGYVPSSPNGSITVAGLNVSLTIAFTPSTAALYPVTFTESGLASGTSWSIDLGSQQWHSTSTTLVVDESNGSYSFVIVNVSGYNSSPSGTDNITVRGVAVGVSIVYSSSAVTPTEYPITFSETGLVAGTEWYVTPTDALPVGSDTSTLVINETNATYTFTPSVPANASSPYHVDATPIAVTVAGAPLTEPTIVFTPVGSVAVQETGLPAGLSWTWVAHGPNGSASGVGNSSEPLADGTYTVEAEATGYQGTTSSTNYTVTGFGTTAVTVTFTAVTTAPSSGSSGPSLTLEYLIIGLLVVVAVLALIGMLVYRRRANAPPPPPPEPYKTGNEPPATGPDGKTPPSS